MGQGTGGNFEKLEKLGKLEKRTRNTPELIQDSVSGKYLTDTFIQGTSVADIMRPFGLHNAYLLNFCLPL